MRQQNLRTAPSRFDGFARLVLCYKLVNLLVSRKELRIKLCLLAIEFLLRCRESLFEIVTFLGTLLRFCAEPFEFFGVDVADFL